MELGVVSCEVQPLTLRREELPVQRSQAAASVQQQEALRQLLRVLPPSSASRAAHHGATQTRES